MIYLQNRAEPSAPMRVLAPLIAIIATLIAGGLLFAVLNKNPFVAIRMIIWDPVFGEFAFYYRGQVLIKAAPLIIIAQGLAFGFRAGFWNIGAEGQFIMGALGGGAVGLAFYPADPASVDSAFILPMMVISGGIAGGLWGLIPAYLKIRFNANEILVSLMLVYVALQFLNGMVTGPLRNPEGFNFPESRSFQDWDSAHNAELWLGSGVHIGVFAAVIISLLAYVISTRHILGYHINLSGFSLRAARFAGVKPHVMIALCLGLSGALAGIAGVFELTGPAGKLSTTFPLGYGFTAIIVAFLGRLHPLGIVLAGVLLAITYVGGDIIQAEFGLPKASIQVFQGMLLFFLLATDVLIRFRVRIGGGHA